MPSVRGAALPFLTVLAGAMAMASGMAQGVTQGVVKAGVQAGVQGAAGLAVADAASAPSQVPRAGGAPPSPAGAVARIQAVWGAPLHCPETLARLNAALQQPRGVDLLAAGRQFDQGDCVVRDGATAQQFYLQAARLGEPEAAQRLARLSGAGQGVEQSYASAGAWLSGKGDSQEALDPWDYSVGRAYTVIAGVLEQVRFPTANWPVGLEVTMALQADAQADAGLSWRFTGEAVTQAEALRAPLTAAIEAARSQVAEKLVPPDPQYSVPVSVTVPLTVQHAGVGRFVVTEHDPVLR